MNDKFILMNKEKELLIYLEQYVFHAMPKNEKILRDNINSEMYEIIKNTARISVNKGNIKAKYINDIKVNIILLDFYIGILNSKNYIINKRFLSSIKKLDEIRKILSGFDKGINDESL